MFFFFHHLQQTLTLTLAGSALHQSMACGYAGTSSLLNNNLLYFLPFILFQFVSWLLKHRIFAEGWFTEAAHNQAMRFGDLPFWTLELSDQIHEVACFGDKEASIGNLDNEACVLPPQLLFRDPFFDQLIVNVYQPGYLCTC